MPINADTISKVISDTLRGTLADATLADRQGYAEWADSVAPLVAEYAVLAAAGDPQAVFMLSHIRAQAEAKAWAILIGIESGLSTKAGDLAITVATVAGAVLKSLLVLGVL